MSIVGSLKVEVVTPERAFLSLHSPLCVLPTQMGQVEILPMHMPVIGALDAGTMIVEVDGKRRNFYVEGGFYEVANDTVSILTDVALGSEDFDLNAAQENLKEVEARYHEVVSKAKNAEIEVSVLEEHEAELRRAQQRVAFGSEK